MKSGGDACFDIGGRGDHRRDKRVMNEMPKSLQVYIVEDSQIVERFLAAAIAAAGAHTASVGYGEMARSRWISRARRSDRRR